MIHHRVDFRGGAHTWNLFRDEKTGKLYSLDSLWKIVHSFVDMPPKSLDVRYKTPVEDVIFDRYGPAQTKSQGTKDDPAVAELKKIVRYIETTPFKLACFTFIQGGIDLTLKDGTVKRVPHRVAEIYQLITTDSRTSTDLLSAIKEIAMNAIQHPRWGQYSATRDFYNSVVSGGELPDDDEKIERESMQL